MDGRELLITTPAGSLFPERNNIVCVCRSDPVAIAFQKMMSNNILSVPVYDQVRRSFTHFLDMVDVVAFAVGHIKAQQAPDLTCFMDTPLLQTVSCGEVSDLSKRNPYCPVEGGAPLIEALHLMVKWGVHRIPIVDSEGELITIISQSQLSTFVYKYLYNFPNSLIKQTAASIATAISIENQESTTNAFGVISVGLQDRAIDAFIKMHEKRVSGVAVLNDEGAIVGNISASDLKAIGFDGTLLTRLYYPVSEFLRLIHPPTKTTNGIPQEARFAPPAVVLPTATFGAVLGSLVNSHIHRVYVVDDENRPTGVVGYAEILRAVQDSLLQPYKGPTFHQSSLSLYL
jgi:CBS domain-containing protein